MCKRWRKKGWQSVEPKILNFADALTLADILYTRLSQYSHEMDAENYVMRGIMSMSDEEVRWLLAVVRPTSFTSEGTLDELIKFILDSRIVPLLCGRVGGVWQA